MTGLTFRIDLGKYACPVCERRFHELAEKKKHMRKHGPKPAKAKR